MLIVGTNKRKRKSSSSKYHTLKPKTQRNYKQKYNTINQNTTIQSSYNPNNIKNHQFKEFGQNYFDKIIPKTDRRKKSKPAVKSIQQIERLKEDFKDMKIAMAKLTLNQNHIKSIKKDNILKATPNKQLQTVCKQYNKKIDKLQQQLQIKQLTNQKLQQAHIRSQVYAFQTIDFTQNLKNQLNELAFQHIRCQQKTIQLKKANKHIQQLKKLIQKLQQDYHNILNQNNNLKLFLDTFQHKNTKQNNKINIFDNFQQLKKQNKQLKQYIKNKFQQKYQNQNNIIQQINKLQYNYIQTYNQVQKLNQKIIIQFNYQINKSTKLNQIEQQIKLSYDKLKVQYQKSVNNYNQIIINKSLLDTKIMENIKENHLQKEEILYLKNYLENKESQYKESQKMIEQKDQKIALYEQMLLKIIQKLLDLQKQVTPKRQSTNQTSITDIRNEFQQLLQFIQNKQNSQKNQIIHTIQTLKNMNSKLKNDLYLISTEAKQNLEQIDEQNVLNQAKVHKLQEQIKNLTQLFQELCNKAAYVQDLNQSLKQQIAIQEKDIQQMKKKIYQSTNLANQIPQKKKNIKNNINKIPAPLSQRNNIQNQSDVLSSKRQEDIKEFMAYKEKINEKQQIKPPFNSKDLQTKSKFIHKQNDEPGIKMTLFGKDLMIKAKYNSVNNDNHL